MGKMLANAVMLCISTTASALCNVGDNVSVQWKGKWYDARVIDHSPTKCLIKYIGYDSSWNEWVGPKRYLHKKNRVRVLWKNKWYPATVLKRRQNAYYIH